MRCRTAGSSANCTICCDQLLAAVVGRVALAGDHDLHRPVAGRAAAHVSRSGSRSISVSRLYDGTRRANPMVSTSGSKTESVQPSSASVSPALQRRGAHAGGGSRRPAARAASRRTRPQVAVADAVDRRPTPAPSVERRRRRPRARRGRGSRGPSRSGACTPLVIELIGTSVGSKPGHRPANMLPADVAVQLGDAVGPLAEPQAHVGHVEDRRVVLGAERRGRGSTGDAGHPRSR